MEFLLENCKKLNTEVLAYRQITAYQLANELHLADISTILEKFGCEVLPVDSDYYDDSDDSDFDSDDN